jgi:hypothetical protein
MEKQEHAENRGEVPAGVSRYILAYCDIEGSREFFKYAYTQTGIKYKGKEVSPIHMYTCIRCIGEKNTRNTKSLQSLMEKFGGVEAK